MHPSLNMASLTITHSRDHILTLSNRIDEKHRVSAHDAVREMGPREGHRAQSEVAHEYCTGTAATHSPTVVV